MRYVAQIEITDEMEYNSKIMSPIEEIQKLVRTHFTDYLRRVIYDSGTYNVNTNVNITEQFADAWMVEE